MKGEVRGRQGRGRQWEGKERGEWEGEMKGKEGEKQRERGEKF